MKHNWRLSCSEKARIVEDYKSGMHAKELGVRHGVSGTAISGILKRRGVTIRAPGNSSRKYKLESDSFDALDVDARYWFGFLVADGMLNLKNKNYEIRLTLSGRDIAHVYKLRDFLKSEHPVKPVEVTGYPGSKRAYKVCFHSKALAYSLLRLGFIEDSLKRMAPEPMAFCPEFWRGVVDGDGWVGHHIDGNARLDLVGGHNLMDQFSEYVKRFAPDSRVHAVPHKSIYRVALSHGTARLVVDSLYGNDHVSLSRKQARADVILSGVRRGWMREYSVEVQ